MKRYRSRDITWKKRLCVALALFLITGETCFLRGEASSPAGAENQENSETDLSGKKTEVPVSGDVETNTQESAKTESESSETEVSAADVPQTEEPELSVTEIPAADAPQTDEPEPPVSEPGADYSENAEPDLPEPESGENEPEFPALEDPEISPSETALPKEEISETEGLTCLQIPEKLEIVIDPWEMDEKTQIYSEPFVVKNTGDSPGILTLSFTCRVDEEGGVTISKTQEGLHESEEKRIYIKAILGNGEESVFTEDGVQCQAELRPGEELSLWFEGEINENAEEEWKDGDIEIEGIYSWEEEGIPSEEEQEDGSETEESTGQEKNLPEEPDEELLGEDGLSEDSSKEE